MSDVELRRSGVVVVVPFVRRSGKAGIAKPPSAGAPFFAAFMLSTAVETKVNGSIG